MKVNKLFPECHLKELEGVCVQPGITVKGAPAPARGSCRSFVVSTGWAQTPSTVKEGHIRTEQ